MASHPQNSLTVRQEGDGVRATTTRLNFLFPRSEAHAILDTYNRLISQAEGHFAPRWRSHPGVNIGPAGFHDIIQEVTLHWMYFRVINHLPIRIDQSDWDHPQTRRIIRAGVKRDPSLGSDADTPLCAHLMGLSRAEYLDWCEADDAFLDMW